MSQAPSTPGVAPAVILKLIGRPQTLTLVRGMLAGVAELLSLDAELLDDLKTAVSEACNNVVMHAYPEEQGPLEVLLFLRQTGPEVVVRDEGRGISDLALADDHVEGIGLPLMRALADTLEVERRLGGGTEVRLSFRGERDGRKLLTPADPSAAEDGFSERLAGDAIASLSPVELVGGVLGRLARALAADARFSLDRFSDVYLVTDAIAAHAVTAAATDRIAFALDKGERRLEIRVGPFRAGTGASLSEPSSSRVFPLARLSDELSVEPTAGGEIVRATLLDSQPRA